MNALGSITTVLLDLDGVVRHFDADHVHQVERRHGLPRWCLSAAAFEPSLLQLVTTGRITRTQWTNRIGQMTGSPHAANEWLAATGTVDTTVMREVGRLRHAGFQVALLTNGTDTTADEIDDLQLTNMFDAVFNSADIGYAKPDRRIFEHACHALGAHPSNVLFIDDSRANVNAAADFGITAVRYDETSFRHTVNSVLGILPDSSSTIALMSEPRDS
jgi:putative hydrolase of the HAD superfamily